jgi:hypothetical protein
MQLHFCVGYVTTFIHDVLKILIIRVYVCMPTELKMEQNPAHCSKTKTKLHGLSPRANYTDRPSDRRLSAK